MCFNDNKWGMLITMGRLVIPIDIYLNLAKFQKILGKHGGTFLILISLKNMSEVNNLKCTSSLHGLDNDIPLV